MQFDEVFSGKFWYPNGLLITFPKVKSHTDILAFGLTEEPSDLHG